MEGIKVFSASKAKERVGLGDRVNEWLHSAPQKEIREVSVTQSSDEEFHCLTITFWYRTRD